MNPTREQIEAARELGRQAFARGQKCVPALDRAMCELIGSASRGKRPGFSLHLLDSWIGGWTEANLAS